MHLYREDQQVFAYSRFFTANRNAAIVGSVKVSRWQGQPLALEQLFGIRPQALLQNGGCSSLWHVGRFAIARGYKDGGALLRRLITLAIYPICGHANSLMVAECDRRFAHGLNRLGIRTGTLGPGKRYLGSETIPLYTTGQWLQSFLNKSPYLQEAVRLYQDDVFAGAPQPC